MPTSYDNHQFSPKETMIEIHQDVKWIKKALDETKSEIKLIEMKIDSKIDEIYNDFDPRIRVVENRSSRNKEAIKIIIVILVALIGMIGGIILWSAQP